MRPKAVIVLRARSGCTSMKSPWSQICWMMMLTSIGVLKPVGELKAFFSRMSMSQVLRSIGSEVGW